MPAICTNAPYCVPEDEDVDPLISADRARHNAFVKRAQESTVEITALRRSGSDGLTRVTSTGALIGHKGLVLTSYNGVSYAEFITVSYRRVTDEETPRTYREVPAELVLFSRERDVAVLRVKDQTLMPAPFPLRRGPPVTADTVWHFGVDTPVGKARLGDVDAQFNNSRDWMIVSATAKVRDAGSPLVNSCGELVGVVLFDNGKGVTYALAIDQVFRILDLKMQDLY